MHNDTAIKLARGTEREYSGNINLWDPTVGQRRLRAINNEPLRRKSTASAKLKVA